MQLEKKPNFIKAAKLSDFFLFYRDLDNLYESLLYFTEDWSSLTTNKILYIDSIILWILFITKNRGSLPAFY
jgi:hypothetical protein